MEDIKRLGSIECGEKAAKHFSFDNGFRNLNHGMLTSLHPAKSLRKLLKPTMRTRYQPLSEQMSVRFANRKKDPSEHFPSTSSQSYGITKTKQRQDRTLIFATNIQSIWMSPERLSQTTYTLLWTLVSLSTTQRLASTLY